VEHDFIQEGDILYKIVRKYLLHLIYYYLRDEFYSIELLEEKIQEILLII
jgi:hypothetical protein